MVQVKMSHNGDVHAVNTGGMIRQVKTKCGIISSMFYGKKEMNEEIKYMDLNDFMDLGFLQEVNRLFFHPLGLALEVFVNDEGKAVQLGKIWDYRDEPEGMCFGDLDEEAKIKAINVQNEYKKHLEHRVALFGDPIQPIH